ncbi:MAG TPA: hypothetical protein VM328_12425 [Fimbriimonadaceae bacterium]|nr:hypothetical protein [Fimbriimonadaceae bacterium]
MRLHAVLPLSALLCFAALGRAADYELVVYGASALKDEKTIAVYDPTGTLTAGDSIVKVTFASGGSQQAKLRVAGVKDRQGMLLANRGHAFGFDGVIMLQEGRLQGGASASLNPYAPSSTMKGFKSNDKDMTLTERLARWPWQWIILGLILFFVAAVFFTKSKAEPVPGTPYAGRRGLEEAIRDIRSRLEQIDANQKELVKKPPVLRSFRAQIDGFDQRLKKLEGTATASQRSVLGVASSLTALKQQLTALGDDLLKADEGVKINNDILAKLSQEMSESSSALERKVSELQAAQEGFSGKLQAVESLEGLIQQSVAQGEAVAAAGKVNADRVSAVEQEVVQGRKELARAVEHLSRNLAQAMQSLEAIGKEAKDASTLGAATAAGLRSLEANQERWAKLQEAAAQLIVKDLEALKAAGAFLSGEVGSVKTEQVELMSKLDETVKALAEEFGHLEERMSQPNAALAALAEELRHLRDGQNSQADQLGSLSESVGRRIEDLGKAVEAFRAKLAEPQKDDGRLAEAHADLAGRLEALKKQVQVLQSKQESIVINASADDSSLVSEQLKELLSAQSALKSLESCLQSVEHRLESLPKLEAGLQALSLLENRLEALPRLESAVESLSKLEARMAQLESRPESVPAVAPITDGLEQKLEVIQERSAANESSLQKLTELVARLGAEGEEARKATEARLGELMEQVDARAEEQKQALMAQPVLRGSGTDQLEDILRRNAEEAAERAPEPEAHAEGLPLTVLEAVRALNQAPAEDEPEPEDAPGDLPAEGLAGSEVAEVVSLPSSLEDEEAEAEELPEGAAAVSLQWPCEGGSSERRWSTHLQKSLPVRADGEIKPLMPIETPDISSPVTNMIYTNGQVVYSHGAWLRAFWPGRESRAASLSVELPEEAWRLLAVGSSVFCVGAEQVQVLALNDGGEIAAFEGKFLNQATVGKHWVGMRAVGSLQSVEMRSGKGDLIGKPHQLQIGSDERTFLVSHGEDLFVGAESGSLFHFSLTENRALGEVDGKLTHLAFSRGELVALSSKGNGSIATVLSPEGKVLRKGGVPAADDSLNMVLMSDRLYYLGKKGEVHCLNLKKMQMVGSRQVKGATRIRKMLGFQNGTQHLLVMATRDGSGQAGRVLMLDMKTGEEAKLCAVNQPHLEVIAADGRVVVSTSCSFQNIIRIFEPFAFARSQSRAA